MQIDQSLLQPIQKFLACPTPGRWLEEAVKPESLPILLVDHANCELKAAQTAMWLIRKYAATQESAEALLAWLKPYEDFVYRKIGDGDFSQVAGLSKKLVGRSGFVHGDDLIDKMVLLIKEELHHFQQVLEFLELFNIPYDTLNASRYARGLMADVRTHEPATLIDKLICGAFIEARSCERFAALAPHVAPELGEFYISLLRSEARHFQDYLILAQDIAGEDIGNRIAHFRQLEAELVSTSDPQFRFHSGVPN